MRSRRLVLVGYAAFVSATCGDRASARITLEAGARTPAPVLVIAAPEAPRFIQVERTSERPASAGDPVMWRLVRRPDTTVTPPVRVVYGIVPEGYSAAAPAAVLFPANYRVFAKLTHGSGVRTFVVATDGSVR